MRDVPRITPREAHEKVAAGRALLVCAYEDIERCGTMRLEGAVSMQEFRSRRRDLRKDQEIIFYCT